MLCQFFSLAIVFIVQWVMEKRMKKILVGAVALLLLTGCINAKKQKMEDACKEIVRGHVINPKKVSFSEIQMSSTPLLKEEFVLDYYGSSNDLNEEQRMTIEWLFSHGAKGATRRRVDISYIDASERAHQLEHEKAVCTYIQYESEAGLSGFYVKGIEVRKKNLFEYFELTTLPKGLDEFGRIRL